MSEPTIEQRRTMAILQIRLDGAEPWDIRDYVREQETAGNDPWKIEPGGKPLDAAQIEAIIENADAVIIDANPECPPDVALRKAKLKSLFARAVSAGEVATAARILRDVGEIEKEYQANDDADDDDQEHEHAPSELGEYHKILLLEIQKRHLEIANLAPHTLHDWTDQMEFGPTFSASQWFNCQGNDCERMRWARTLTELIDAGLVERDKAKHAKWANVQLSEAGQKVAAELLKIKIAS